MSKHTSIRSQTILWLLTIPEEELSDTMRVAKQKSDNDIAFLEFLENDLIDEIEDFVAWNVEMSYSL